MQKNLLQFMKAECNLWALHPMLWSGRYIRPDKIVRSFEDINPQELKTRGIEAIGVDYDGVIVPYHSYDKPTEPKIEKLHQLSKDFSIGILSNRRGALLHSLQTTLHQFPILRCDKMKPHPDTYRDAARALGSPLHKIAIVEDRLITGTAGAKRIGLYTIWVTPAVASEREPWNLSIYRFLEETVLGFHKKWQK